MQSLFNTKVSFYIRYILFFNLRTSLRQWSEHDSTILPQFHIIRKKRQEEIKIIYIMKITKKKDELKKKKMN